MRNEDYMYLYSQLTNDKIPAHIKDKIEKDVELTDTEESEILNIIRKDRGMKKITYKGVTHLYNNVLNTDCGVSIPCQGKHLESVNPLENISEITCKQCLATLNIN